MLHCRKEVEDGLDLSYPDFEDYYSRSKEPAPNNIFDALRPAMRGSRGFCHTPALIKVIPPTKENPGCLWLLPGHAKIQEFDTRLTLAYSSNLINTALLVVFEDLCEKIAKKYSPDYILIDLDPSRGRCNGHLICSSDGLIIPCEADGPSHDAVKDALTWTMKFKENHEEMARSIARAEEDIVVPPCRVKILGSMHSNFTKQLKQDEKTYYTAEYAFWMRKIDAAMAGRLPELQAAGLAFTNEEYEAAGVHLKALCISRTPNWSSINGFIDKHGVPVAFLDPGTLRDRTKRRKLYGKELENKEKTIAECAEVLSNARARVMKLLHGTAPVLRRSGSGGPPSLPLPIPLMQVPMEDERVAETPAECKRRLEAQASFAAAEGTGIAIDMDASTADEAGPSGQ